MKNPIVSAWRIFRDVHNTLYVISSRAGFWDDLAGRAGTGLFAVSAIKAMVLLMLFELMEIATHRQFLGKWIVVFGYLAVFAGDYWVLCKQGAGEAFAERFDAMRRNKQVALRTLAIGFVAATFAFFLFCFLPLYQRAFNILPPS